MSSLVDSEEDDYARLMRLLAEEDASGEDDDKADQEPMTSVVSQLETSDQDVFQILQTSCSVEESQESSNSAQVKNALVSSNNDTNTRQRTRTESIPDGVSLEWEDDGSDRCSMDQPGKSVNQYHSKHWLGFLYLLLFLSRLGVFIITLGVCCVF